MLLVLDRKYVLENPNFLWKKFIRCLADDYFRPPTQAQADLSFCFWYHASLNNRGSHQEYLEVVEPALDLAAAERALRRIGAEIYFDNLAEAVRRDSADAYRKADGMFWYIQASQTDLMRCIRGYLLTHLHEFFMFKD